MEFKFGCECGEEIVDFSRSDNDGDTVDCRTVCDDCGRVYAITITAISGPDS